MKPNRLASEKSPYLLQHKDNPVDWYPWGEEAFRAAKDQDKPIFLSVGYATCHWCHVMERESFEDPQVAKLLNEHFISVKVDREERPDVDQLYMQALLGMSGQGGWPMSQFLTPSKKPFFAGTYFPKEQFMQLLAAIGSTWVEDREKVITSGDKVTAYLEDRLRSSRHRDVQPQLLMEFVNQLKESFDADYGGFGAAPKFPRGMALGLLLRLHRRTGDDGILQMVTTTLTRMARGGIYDQVGGGFARYATDPQWLVPHFEKMLYDNALLIGVYVEAYQVTGDELFAGVVHETLDYLLGTMVSPEGGFFSAEDADSEGEEGKFYVWDYDELTALLSDREIKLVETAFGVNPAGNFEGKNILTFADKLPWRHRTEKAFSDLREKLWQVREKRIHPLKDDKILTAWNGLMIGALAKAYFVFEEKRYLDAAEKVVNFLENRMLTDEKLFRRFRDAERALDGCLNDYAFLIHGLIELYFVTGKSHYFQLAQRLQALQDDLFWDSDEGGYFFTSRKAEKLLVRYKDYEEGAIPSGNALAALNLLRLADLTGDSTKMDRANALLKLMAGMIGEYAMAYPQALIAIDYSLDRSNQLVINGDGRELRAQLRKEFLPNLVLVDIDASSGGEELPAIARDKKSNDGATYYLCERGKCQAPTVDANEVMSQLRKVEPVT